ncbi:MAG: PASTA domain-containing protein [Acidimicrobiales bacterium]
MPCDLSSIHVPDLFGMSTPEAVGLLSGLGMQLHLVDVPTLFPESGHVVSTSPIRGATLITGQVITIDIGVPLRSMSA